MKKLAGALTAAALLAAAGCGDRGADPSAGIGAQPAAPSASGTESAAAGTWGDLTKVCGPSEGGGKVPAADAQGVSADAIKLGTVADPGFAAKPGLNQELFDAGEAFAEWCNAAGGINGKRIELTQRDSKLTDYQPVIEKSCQEDFALVGGGAVQDNLWPNVGPPCGLIDVAGFAVTPAKAGVANQTIADSRTVQAVPNPSNQYPVGGALLLDAKYPGAKDHTGILYADFQTLIDQKIKERKALEAIDHAIVHEAAYSVLGEANWKPFATAIEGDGVRFLKFIGEPTNMGNLDQAMAQTGYVPEVRLLETNFYDPGYIEAAGPAANGSYIQSTFVPLEEADANPATKLYVDNVAKIDGKKAVLGLQSTSAWLLFATLAKACDVKDNLTRTCILEGAKEITEWTGGGLHAPSSPATNEGSRCTMLLTVKDEAFTRWAPEKGFICDPKNVVTIE